MSPEQAAGAVPIGPQSDLFSIGTILYEMLAGRRPFVGETWASTLARIMENEPEPLRSACPDAGEALERIVDRCLSKDPAGRYANAGESWCAPCARRAASQDSSGGDPGRFRWGVDPPNEPSWRWLPPRLVIAAAVLCARSASEESRSTTSRSGPSDPPLLPPGEGASVRPPPSPSCRSPFTVRTTCATSPTGWCNCSAPLSTAPETLRSIDARAILGLVAREEVDVADPHQGRAVARRLGARRFVLGDIFAAGGELRINAALYEAQGDDAAIVAEAAAEGEAERVFDLIDTIARQILTDPGRRPSERVTRVAAVTTHSLPALKAYLEGERQFRRAATSCRPWKRSRERPLRGRYLRPRLLPVERGGGVGDPHRAVAPGCRTGGAPCGAPVGARSPSAARPLSPGGVVTRTKGSGFTGRYSAPIPMMWRRGPSWERSCSTVGRSEGAAGVGGAASRSTGCCSTNRNTSRRWCTWHGSPRLEGRVTMTSTKSPAV